MTTPSDQFAFRVSGPTELLALVPYLLGYHPASSLVLIAVTGSRLLNVARLDLPDAADQQPLLRDGLHQIAALVKAHGASGAILVGYGTAEQVDPAMRAATSVLATTSIPVQDAMRVDAGRYFALNCTDPACCPRDGIPFDPTTSVAAATATAAGMVALPDREALADKLTPLTGPARTRMTAATLAAAELVLNLINTVAPGADTDPTIELSDAAELELLTAARTCLADAEQRYREGTSVDDAQAALITVLVDLAPVRALAARRTTAEPWQIHMWTDLIRRAEPDFTAGPATILTLCALQAGNGALAAIAIQRALQAAPDDPFANIIARAVAAGVDPATITAAVRAD